MPCFYTNEGWSEAKLPTPGVVTRAEVVGGAMPAVGTSLTASTSQIVDLLCDEALDGTPLLIEATPSSQSALHIDVCDTLRYDARAGRLQLTLTHDTHQSVPACHSGPHLEAKRLQHTKHGHGAQFHATYSHSLKVEWRTAPRHTRNKVAFIVATAFAEANVSAVVAASDNAHAHLQLVYKFTDTTPAPFTTTLTSAPPASIADVDPLDAYESLTLLLLDPPQLHTPAADYISTFRCALALTRAPHPKHTVLGTIHPDIVTSLAQTSWRVFSIHTANLHILLYREGDRLHKWACTN
jgi:hypothetical protein